MGRDLYVGNIPYETTEAELKRIFSVSGTVSSVHMITDPDTGVFKGCAYVKMATAEEAADAVATLDGALVENRLITVGEARLRTRPGISTGRPASGRPASGHPASGHPASGHPASGRPASGRPASGHPASGHPASGRPASGRPASGRPASGRPASGRPASGGPPPGPRPKKPGPGRRS